MRDLDQAPGPIDGKVARADRHLVADERGIEGELSVLERLAHLLLQLLGAAGLVVDELDGRAVLAFAAIDAIDVAVQLETLELGRHAARLDFAACQRQPLRSRPVQPLDVARHEAGEAGVVGQECGRVDSHRGADALADLAQSRLVLIRRSRRAALAMKLSSTSCSHVP
jgi:hypothetical protein